MTVPSCVNLVVRQTCVPWRMVSRTSFAGTMAPEKCAMMKTLPLCRVILEAAAVDTAVVDDIAGFPLADGFPCRDCGRLILQQRRHLMTDLLLQDVRQLTTGEQ